MNIIGLVIQNAREKATSPKFIRIAAMSAFIVLVATQAVMLLAVVPYLGKAHLTAGKAWELLVSGGARPAADTAALFVRLISLLALKYSAVFIALCAVAIAAGVMLIDAAGDDLISSNRMLSLGLVLALAGAAVVLAAAEAAPFLVPVNYALTSVNFRG